MLRLALIAVCILIGCAADPASERRAAPARRAAVAPAGPDRALELAQLLPSGADRCVVARPGRVPAQRRPLIARVSQAAPLAWIAELEVEAYASAERESAGGSSGEVTLLFMRSADRARMRAQLGAHSGLLLHWQGDDPECTPRECPLRARFASDHVVLIERGPFVPIARAGVEVQCVRMAERSPAAAELSVARSRSFGSFTFSSLPLRASSELRAHAGGIRVSRLDRMRDPIEAERVFGEGLSAGELLLPRSGPVGSNVQRTREGASVRTEFDLVWEDLEFARDDEARLRATVPAAAVLLAQPPAEGGELPVRREDVLAELGYRLERMHGVEGEERKSQARAASSLLERALERDPDDEGLAVLLAQLLLSELAEPEKARALAQRFAARPGASRSWRSVERHAAALTGVEALADTLVKHGLDRRRARLAANEIVTRMRSGASFERAEGETLEAQP